MVWNKYDDLSKKAIFRIITVKNAFEIARKLREF